MSIPFPHQESDLTFVSTSDCLNDRFREAPLDLATKSSRNHRNAQRYRKGKRFWRQTEPQKLRPQTCAKAEAKPNPITGQHVELTVQSASNGLVDKVGLKTFLAAQLPKHMMPKRIRVASVSVGHRFKRA